MGSAAILRSAGPEDVGTLVELRIRFMRIVKNGGLPDEEDWRLGLARYFSSWMGRGRLMAWLAEEDGRPLASAALRLDPSRSQPPAWEGYVMSVYTEPEARRRGLARNLLGLLAAEAGTRHLSRLSLHPTPESVPFYQALGFRAYRSLMVLPKEDFYALCHPSL